MAAIDSERYLEHVPADVNEASVTT
jgi:hypothetical protein